MIADPGPSNTGLVTSLGYLKPSALLGHRPFSLAMLSDECPPQDGPVIY